MMGRLLGCQPLRHIPLPGVLRIVRPPLLCQPGVLGLVGRLLLCQGIRHLFPWCLHLLPGLGLGSTIRRKTAYIYEMAPTSRQVSGTNLMQTVPCVQSRRSSRRTQSFPGWVQMRGLSTLTMQSRMYSASSVRNRCGFAQMQPAVMTRTHRMLPSGLPTLSVYRRLMPARWMRATQLWLG